LLRRHIARAPAEPSAAGRRLYLSTTRLLAVLVAVALGGGAAAACAAARSHGHHRRAPRLAAVAAHIDTWAFDDGCNGGSGAAPSLVRGWVTFAESHCGPNARKPLADCHAGGQVYCRVMQYLDTEWYYSVDAVPVARAATGGWWLHKPGPLTIGTLGAIASDSLGGGYLLNQSNPAVRSFFQSYVRANYDSSDGLLMDWQSPSLMQELYYSNCGCSTTQEIGSDAALRASHRAMAAAMTHRNGAPFLQADNTLPSNQYLPQGFDMLDRANGVNGWITEGEPISSGQFDPYFAALLDQMAYITNRTQGFIVLLSRSPAGAAYQELSRRVQEATVLLGFKPHQVVDWADFEEGDGNLAVWPEEGIVPTQPIQSMPAPGGAGCLAGTGVTCTRGGHTSLEVAPGVYRRAFGACYRQRLRIGACAAVVNTTGHPVVVRRSWVRGVRLRHQITMIGGDVQSGGRVDPTGAPFAAGSTIIGPHDGVLLAS
jgi:hypothetical protein